MPDCAYRDFFSWAFSTKNPLRTEWIQATGVHKLVELTLQLLDGLISTDEWPQLVEYTVLMNIYQIFEIVSDNLAIGLANQKPDDYSHVLRRKLSFTFNNAMVAKLQGVGTPTAELLKPVRFAAQQISASEQTLCPDKHRAFIEAYMAQNKTHSYSAIGDSIWPSLIANIETCVELMLSTGSCYTGYLVTQGLINRYQGVNWLLNEWSTNLDARIRTGGKTILVVPTLAFYVAVLLEKINPTIKSRQIANSGILAEALNTAAVLVRLLNDLGTNLLTQSETERHVLIAQLQSVAQQHPMPLTIGELLVQHEEGTNPLLTRIQKDLQHGEFNLCIQDRANSLATHDTLFSFGKEIDQYASVYREYQLQFSQQLEALRTMLDDPTISLMLERFVRFHEALYSQHFDQPVGEYAI
jgi:hypothetical protein